MKVNGKNTPHSTQNKINKYFTIHFPMTNKVLQKKADKMMFCIQESKNK